MNNVQSNIIHYIKSLFRDRYKVGEYPFDIANYVKSDWNNVLLIQDGDEDLITDTNNKYVNKNYYLTLWYYSNNSKKRIDYILEQQAYIEGIMLDNPTFDGNSDCIDILSIEKGDKLPTWSGDIPGYYGNKSCRKLNFKIRLRQTR